MCQKPPLEMPVIGPSCRNVEKPLHGFRVFAENPEEDTGITIDQISHTKGNTQLFSDPLISFPAIPRDNGCRLLVVFYRGNDGIGGKPAGEYSMGYPLAVKRVCKTCRVPREEYPASGNSSSDAAKGDIVSVHV